MEREELLSRMDICRGHKTESADEELRELLAAVDEDPTLRAMLARVQELDARIAEALADVDVPEGLAERITARLAKAADTSAASQHVLPLREGEGASPADESQASRGSRISRRAWALGVGAAAAAAALAAALWMRPVATELTEDAIASAARELFEQDRMEGTLVRATAPPAGYPPSSQVLSLPDMRWHRLGKFLGHSGVAYEMGRARVRAALYVIRLAAVPGMPKIAVGHISTIPRPASTGGMTTAVWREQGLLYVLVVEGGEGEYRQFIATTPAMA